MEELHCKIKYQYVQMILTPGALTYMRDLLYVFSHILGEEEDAIICCVLDAIDSAHVTNVRSEEELKSLIARNQNR